MSGLKLPVWDSPEALFRKLTVNQDGFDVFEAKRPFWDGHYWLSDNGFDFITIVRPQRRRINWALSSGRTGDFKGIHAVLDTVSTRGVVVDDCGSVFGSRPDWSQCWLFLDVR
jgi:hypothetical protein